MSLAEEISRDLRSAKPSQLDQKYLSYVIALGRPSPRILPTKYKRCGFLSPTHVKQKSLLKLERPASKLIRLIVSPPVYKMSLFGANKHAQISSDRSIEDASTFR